MYQYSYADILADNASEARARERQALDHAVALLETAALTSPGSSGESDALDFTVGLWASFIKDLAHPGNALSDRLRADLMSVGLGIIAEANRIVQGRSRDLAGLAEICAIVRDGLN